jgi:peroxiredoxin
MSELHGLQTRITEFEGSGTQLVAVSPDTVQENLKVAERLDLSFPILSDPDLELTKAMGVLHEGGGPMGSDIPRPAVFIVEDGVVQWKDVTGNWRIRIRPETLLGALAQ